MLYLLGQNISCGFDQFSCGDRCIPASSVCDGMTDCSSGADEINCTAVGKYNRSHLHNPAFCSEFLCKFSYPLVCIPKVWVCNGKQDRPKGEDEKYCAGPGKFEAKPCAVS